MWIPITLIILSVICFISWGATLSAEPHSKHNPKLTKEDIDEMCKFNFMFTYSLICAWYFYNHFL